MFSNPWAIHQIYHLSIYIFCGIDKINVCQLYHSYGMLLPPMIKKLSIHVHIYFDNRMVVLLVILVKAILSHHLPTISHLLFQVHLLCQTNRKLPLNLSVRYLCKYVQLFMRSNIIMMKNSLNL